MGGEIGRVYRDACEVTGDILGHGTGRKMVKSCVTDHFASTH